LKLLNELAAQMLLQVKWQKVLTDILEHTNQNTT